MVVRGKVINTLRLEDLSFFTIKNHGKINVTTISFLPVKDDYVRVRGVVDDKFYYQRDTILVIKEIVEIDKNVAKVLKMFLLDLSLFIPQNYKKLINSYNL